MMMRKIFWLVLVLAAVMIAGGVSACSCGDDDDDDDGHPSTLPIDPAECDALMGFVFDICNLDVNEWAKDLALSYCNEGFNADWECLIDCEATSANDCDAFTACVINNC